MIMLYLDKMMLKYLSLILLNNTFKWRIKFQLFINGALIACSVGFAEFSYIV